MIKMQDDVILKETEPDECPFRFDGIHVICTVGFFLAYKEEALSIINQAQELIRQVEKPGRIQVFSRKGKTFWAVSNWDGTPVEEYEHPEELCVCYMFPDEY